MGIDKVIENVVEEVGEKIPSSSERMDFTLKALDNEVNEDDKFTKRARPSVIYAGIFVILSEVFGLRLSALNWAFTDSELLKMAMSHSNTVLISFIGVWASIVSIYTWKRSGEKRTHTTEVKKARWQYRLDKLREKRK